MRKTSWAVLSLVSAVAFATLAAAPAPQGSGYHLLKKLTLGGEGAWDYLSADPGSHRLFISRGTHIMVVDADGAVVERNWVGAYVEVVGIAKEVPSLIPLVCSI